MKNPYLADPELAEEGWYWYNEEAGESNGPYKTEAEAKSVLDDYLAWLDRG